MAKDSSRFQDLKARIKSYKNLKKEFYELDVDEDKKINKYIKLFQQFNDEFLDAVGELGMTTANVTAMSTGETNSFIALAKTFIGHTYIWGAEGEISDKKGKCFDCSGFVTYLMKEMGLMPKNAPRFTVSTIPGSGYFNEIPWKNKQPGDILCNSSLSHVVIYEGNNRIIHAANSAPYPKGGVKESNLYFTGRAFRIKGFGVE
jgi:hypothetical protein